MPKTKTLSIIPDERIIGKIYFIRGEKVMFDRDLAVLYGVATKVLNQSVKRNIDRFPADFMFKLNKDEMENWKSQIAASNNVESLRSQIVTSKRGGRRYEAYVFTEQGVAMLSSVLNSKRAILVNIQIMRTFTRMRRMLTSNKNLREKIEKLERSDNKNKENIKIIFKVIAKFMATDPKDKGLKIIGFRGNKIN